MFGDNRFHHSFTVIGVSDIELQCLRTFNPFCYSVGTRRVDVNHYDVVSALSELGRYGGTNTGSSAGHSCNRSTHNHSINWMSMK